MVYLKMRGLGGLREASAEEHRFQVHWAFVIGPWVYEFVRAKWKLDFQVTELRNSNWSQHWTKDGSLRWMLRFPLAYTQRYEDDIVDLGDEIARDHRTYSIGSHDCQVAAAKLADDIIDPSLSMYRSGSWKRQVEMKRIAGVRAALLSSTPSEYATDAAAVGLSVSLVALSLTMATAQWLRKPLRRSSDSGSESSDSGDTSSEDEPRRKKR